MSEYLQRVRLLSAALFLVEACLVALTALAIGPDRLNLTGILIVSATAVGAAIAIPLLPWQRLHPNWCLIFGSGAVLVISAVVTMSGGPQSPFLPIVVFVVVVSGTPATSGGH